MQSASPFSLKQHVFTKRALLSFGFSLFLFAVFFSQANLADILRSLRRIDPVFLALAFCAHYASYLFRAARWKAMLAPDGFSGSIISLSKITFLFQSVDCVLPAKLGDVYGSHLMKLNFGLNRSYALGSIFLWRVIDLMFVGGAAVGSAFWLFGGNLPAEVAWMLKFGLPAFVMALAALALFLHHHHRLTGVIASEKIHRLLASFRRGFRLNLRALPVVCVSTALFWALEALRFFCICRAMSVDVQPVAVIFVTFAAMLFTAVPFTPSGLGAVELAMRTLLALIGVAPAAAYPLILWDRFISHWSQIVLGMIFVMFSQPINVKIWHTSELPQNPTDASAE